MNLLTPERVGWTLSPRELTSPAILVAEPLRTIRSCFELKVDIWRSLHHCTAVADHEEGGTFVREIQEMMAVDRIVIRLRGYDRRYVRSPDRLVIGRPVIAQRSEVTRIFLAARGQHQILFATTR
jgi:hypothetical protein